MNRRAWLAGGGLAALAIAAYLPVLSAGFIWDDDRHVTANPALDDARGLAAVWTRLDVTPQYYPLTHTTFWVEHALWGVNPRGYHVTNVLLHATSAILFWRILLLLELPGAWWAAAIFAVHPVHVESVAWISERKNVLSGALYLGAGRVFLGWALGRERGRGRPWVSVALYAAALTAKTITSTLPIALGLIVWWKRGRLGRREGIWLVPMLALGAAFGGITHHLEQTQVGAAGPDWNLSMISRLALSGRIVWFYLDKLVWPSPLIFIYPRWTIDPRDLMAWTWLAAAVAVAAVTWALRRRWGVGPFVALAFFVVTLAPALGFFDVYPMRYAFVADHFQYLASLGPIALVGSWLGTAKRRWASSKTGRAAATVIASIAIVLLAGRTFARCGAYENEEVLWRDTLAKNPDAWIAHNNLGILLAERGAQDEAAEQFERVLALRPDHSGARANLGYLQELMGRDAEAAATLAMAAADRPDDADVRAHLVRVLLRLGRLDEATGPALELARLRPSDPDALCDAGALLARSGRAAEAIPLLERAIALRPGFARAATNLAIARRATADLRYPPSPESPAVERVR